MTDPLAISRRAAFIVLVAGLYFLVWNPLRAWTAEHLAEAIVQPGNPLGDVRTEGRGTILVTTPAPNAETSARFHVHGKWYFLGLVLMIGAGRRRLREYGAFTTFHLAAETIAFLLMAAGVSMGAVFSLMQPLRRYVVPGVTLAFAGMAIHATRRDAGSGQSQDDERKAEGEGLPRVETSG